MLWLAVSGLLTSPLFSVIVYWELRDRHLDTIDSQARAAAAGRIGNMCDGIELS